MARFRFVAVIVAAAMLFSFALAGCSEDEVSLLTALLKAPQMTSYEYEGGAQIELRFDLIEQEDAYSFYSFGLWGRQPASYFKTIEEAVNGAGVSVSAKYSGNIENTKGATEMQLTPIYMGGQMENLKTGIWAAVDLDDPIYIKEYFKLPKIITAGVGWDYFKGRDYLVITSEDLDAFYEEAGMDMSDYFSPDSLNAQIDASEKLSQTMTDLLIYIAMMLDTESAYISSASADESGNSVYNVKITDKGLKEIISALTNIDKDEMKEIARVLLTASQEFFQALGDDENYIYEYIVDELEDVLADFDNWFDESYPMLEEMLKSINRYVGKGSKAKLLGNDGITLKITIDSDGYVVGCDGIIDLIIDHRGFAIVSGERYSEQLSKTHIKLTFNNQFTNVNGDIDVDMPAITPMNSISLTRIIDTLNAQYEPYMDSYEIDPGFAYERAEGDMEGGNGQERPDMLGELPEVSDDDAGADQDGGFDVIETVP
ncbi:MAG: hypothetical protein FWH01_11840 [Oscillospiraceae bacterium]|nr:hypothetical protein [Oscillospiraceae bacterium]